MSTRITGLVEAWGFVIRLRELPAGWTLSHVVLTLVAIVIAVIRGVSVIVPGLRNFVVLIVGIAAIAVLLVGSFMVWVERRITSMVN